jgi:hypothetical protein
MKESFVQIFWRGLIGLFWVFWFLAGVAPLVTAEQLEQARVSQVIQDVRLLQTHGAPQPAVVNDKVIQGMGVRTGVESRAELTFDDLTITRLGANTIFSFKQGTRELDLTSGAVLLQVPPEKPAVKVSTSAVTAAVTGGTALFATGPPMKFMVLEGVGTIYPVGHPERAVTVDGGQMMMMTPDGRMTKPEKFDVKLVVQTSRLIQDFPPLENMPLILAVANLQVAEQLAAITSQPLAKNLIDVLATTDQNANANPVVRVSTSPSRPTPPPITPTPPPITPTPPPPTPTVSPSGTPTKFGTPNTITSPNPYVITSGTVITTDPSITTNGVTDYGKIYRGRTVDGPASAWAFGSTSVFDTASGFDDLIGDSSRAAFKFTALQLTGDPTIDTTNGQLNLALIAVNGITSGGSGGVLTFSGIRGLLLATQNGPITLGPEVSFSSLHDLTIYARGSGSDLTLGSDINTSSQVSLFAERDLSLTSSITTGNLYAFVGRNISINGQEPIHAENITLFAGARILGVIGGNIQTNDLALEILNNGGQIDAGGNISLEITGEIIAQGNATFEIQNVNGTIGQNAPIRVAAATIGANFLSAQIDNSNGGVIGGDAVISMNVRNANVTNDATFAIYGSDGAANSTILVNAGNYNVGGTFLSYIDGNGGITFSNASAHADVLKAGVFGANGVLNIGGGTLSADTMLKLYAPGSKGQLNFISNVTLSGNSAKILAANSITIFNNVVVTIGGALPASVYTNNANYSEQWGGNGTTNGTFAGAGAKRPRPLSEAPPFDGSSPGNPIRGKRATKVINIQNTGQLLSMLDSGVPGRDGRIRVPGRNQRQAANDRININRIMKADRDMADVRRMRDHGAGNPRRGAGTKAF